MKSHSMQTQIKQLTDKSSDLKGQPLKTSLRVMMAVSSAAPPQR